MREAVLAFGGLDVLVSNAGVLSAGRAGGDDPETFELRHPGELHRVLPLREVPLARHEAAARASARRRSADIIQINSKSGLEGSNKNFAYAGGKFGGIGLTQSFALELVEHGIKVNSICPGNFFEGPLWSDPEKGLFVQYLRAGKVPGAKTVDDVRRFYEARVPEGRGCTGGGRGAGHPLPRGAGVRDRTGGARDRRPGDVALRSVHEDEGGSHLRAEGPPAGGVRAPGPEGRRDPGPRGLRQHLHVELQGRRSGGAAQADPQGHRPEPHRHRARVLRRAGRGRRQVAKAVQGRSEVLDPAGAQLREGPRGSALRAGVLVSVHRRRRDLRHHSQRGHGAGLPAHLPGRCVLQGVAGGAHVLHRRRLPRELSHPTRQLRASDGHRRWRLDGAPGRRRPDGVGRHRLRPPLRSPPGSPARDGHRRRAAGACRLHLRRRARAGAGRDPGLQEHEDHGETRGRACGLERGQGIRRRLRLRSRRTGGRAGGPSSRARRLPELLRRTHRSASSRPASTSTTSTTARRTWWARAAETPPT